MEFNFIDQLNYYETILENIFVNIAIPEPQQLVSYFWSYELRSSKGNTINSDDFWEQQLIRKVEDPTILIVADYKKRKIIKKIILDSMLCNDIEKLYNMRNEIHTTAETKKIYIKNALAQYTKLIKYINHITYNTKQFNTVIYPKETDTTPPPEIPLNSKLNKQLVTSIKIVKEQIEKTKENINNLKHQFNNFYDPTKMFEYLTFFDNDTKKIVLQPLKSNTQAELSNIHCTIPQTEDFISNLEITETNISKTNNEIIRMEKRIKTLKRIRDEYVKYDNVMFEIIKQNAILKSYHIKYRLYLKTVKLDINKIKVLPHDIINNIIEYVGNDQLTNIQNHCICKKYFPGGPEDMRTLLKSWKKKHLLRYAKQVYLRYILYFHNTPYSFTRPIQAQSINKDRIIENITRNSKIFTFHEFHRDVYFLTKILNEKKTCKTRTKST